MLRREDFHELVRARITEEGQPGMRSICQKSITRDMVGNQYGSEKTFVLLIHNTVTFVRRSRHAAIITS